MTSNQITLLSRRMAAITLWLIIGMLAFNLACWLFPTWIIERGSMTMSLSGRLLSSLKPDLENLSWGSKCVGIFLSSLPLVVLASGLLSLRALFQQYTYGEYFSSSSAIHLRKLSQAIALWVVANFLCEPLLSVWLTLQNPVGERLISLSFNSSSLIALFLATCIAIVGRILQRAGELNSENQGFI